MTITRVQQVTGVLSGTSDTITLPSTPLYGSTLIAVLSRAGPAPIATSLTQANVTWQPLVSGSHAREVSHQIFYAQRVTTSAGTTITVTRSDIDDYTFAVFEYAGLRRAGTLLDQTATAFDDGNAPYTTATPATTQAAELLLGALPHVYLQRILDDTLLTDAGYWTVDTSIPSSITFTGTAADVTGVVRADPVGSAAWKNYRVAVDVSSTSPFSGSGGWFGIALYGSGEYGNSTGNGYAGLINTVDNSIYAFKIVNGVITTTQYPYGSPINAGQTYRLELRARTLLSGDVLLDFFLDGGLIYSETHSGGPTAGTVALAVSAATSQVATFNNLLAYELSGDLIRQDAPSNGFAIVSQSSTAIVDEARVNLVVVEKEAVATGAQNVATQADDYVWWNGRLVTLFAELGSPEEKSAQLDQYIADEFSVAAELIPVVAQTVAPTAALEVQIQPVVGCLFDVFVGGDGFLFSNLDVLLELGREAELDMYLIGTVTQTTSLQVVVGIQTFPATTQLNVIVGAEGVRLSSRMDLAVLALPDLVNVSTTPEAYRYLECRTLYCNVPKVHEVWSHLDVTVGGLTWMMPFVDVSVEYEDQFRRASMHVLIAPEP